MGNAKTQEELKILLESPVLIYGAGRCALRLILNLKALNANIIGIAVSDIFDNRTIGFEGYQIKTLEEYNDYKASAVVLIATSEKYHNEIIANCLRLGFNNFITYSLDLMELASDISHKKLFEKHGLPFDNDIITIGSGKYLNPFSDIFLNKFGIADQWEDICSTAFGDMSMSFEGPYEFDGVKISEGDTVFDIGASIGYVSVYAASKGAEVYAFEPNPENQLFIEKHNKLNGNRIHLEPFAVSDRCGTADFFINKACSSACSLDAYVAGDGERLLVEQITVDEFVKQKNLKSVDYIHVEIMGSELLMLKGAQKTLKEFAPKLVVAALFFADEMDRVVDIIKKSNPAYKIEQKFGKVYAHI